MIRKALALIALLALGACVASTPAYYDDCPPEGGIGGTGGCSSQQAAS